MTTVDLQELGEDAAALVRRVENGEKFTITVAGRPGARLVGVAPRRWRPWAETAELFRGPDDPEWAADRDLIPDSLRAR